MPSIVAAQPEKPNHYTYLKSFRTEQCKDFLNHRCKLHRPYTCFHWHFANQRRRRPIRKRDGSFNYSADEYCPNYDESTGTCPEGDSCAFLHRTVGDIEKHYHLRYYKTELCMHKMNAAGVCSKNGPHCMFAHGTDDLREPVYDVAQAEGGTRSVSPPSVSQNGDVLQMLDDEPIDPRWSDRTYILNYYKTEKCPKWTLSPQNRICRLGLVCPYHHSFKDRRRSLATIKYRAIACPMVKVNDEWGDVSECDRGDGCPYCHTRMELQYHPDVYKSIKCDKFLSTGHCPKGQFCAFAHGDEVMGQRTCSPAVSDAVTSASLNKIVVTNGMSNSSSGSSMNNLDRVDGLTEIAVNTGADRNNSSPKPELTRLVMGKSSDPNLQQQQQNIQQKTAAGSDLPPASNGFRMPPGALPNGLRMAPGFDMLPPDFGPRFPGFRGPPSGPAHESQLGLSGLMSEMGINGNGPGPGIGYPPPPMHMMSMMARMRVAQMMMPDMQARRQLLMQQAAHLRPPSAPKPTENQLKVSTSLGGVASGMSSGEGSHSIDNLDFDFDTDIRRTARTSGSSGDEVIFTATGSHRAGPAELSPSGLADISPGSSSSAANSKPLLDSPGSSSPTLPTTTSQFFPPSLSSYDQQSLIQHCARMRMELDFARTKIDTIEEEKRRLFHEKEMVLEHLSRIKAEEKSSVNDGQYLRNLHPLSNLDELTVPLLQHIETQLKNDLQRVKTIILQKASGKCLNCLERSASIRLPLCHHKVLCEVCYMKTNECPSCQASVTIPQP